MQNSNSNNNKLSVPEAKDALNNMKFEVARELGVNLKQGYMVKKMIQQYEQEHANRG